MIKLNRDLKKLGNSVKGIVDNSSLRKNLSVLKFCLDSGYIVLIYMKGFGIKQWERRMMIMV